MRHKPFVRAAKRWHAAVADLAESVGAFDEFAARQREIRTSRALARETKRLAHEIGLADTDETGEFTYACEAFMVDIAKSIDEDDGSVTYRLVYLDLY